MSTIVITTPAAPPSSPPWSTPSLNREQRPNSAYALLEAVPIPPFNPTHYPTAMPPPPDPASLGLEPTPAPQHAISAPSAAVVLRGGCLCGRVAVEASDKPAGTTACHCVQCQKASGSAFLGFAHFHNSALRWSNGGDTGADDAGQRQPPPITLTWHSDLAARGTCALCGSPLFMKYHAQPDGTSITLGLLDPRRSTAVIGPVAEHIFLKDRVAWLPPPPDDSSVERYQENNPAFTKRLETWRSLGSPALRDDL